MKEPEIDSEPPGRKSFKGELAGKDLRLDRCIVVLHRWVRHGAHARRPWSASADLNAEFARFRLDPRDQRSDQDFYELISNNNGVFGCMRCSAPHDMCSKETCTQQRSAFLRRRDRRGRR